MENRSVLGVGSAGLSTMFFLKNRNCFPCSSLLFVKSNFEKKVLENSKGSLAAKKKFDAFKKLKDANLVMPFEESFNTVDMIIKNIDKKFENKNLFLIVGLGGMSGNFALEIVRGYGKKGITCYNILYFPIQF